MATGTSKAERRWRRIVADAPMTCENAALATPLSTSLTHARTLSPQASDERWCSALFPRHLNAASRGTPP